MDRVSPGPAAQSPQFGMLSYNGFHFFPTRNPHIKDPGEKKAVPGYSPALPLDKRWWYLCLPRQITAGAEDIG
jgi:hypothetical protein